VTPDRRKIIVVDSRRGSRLRGTTTKDMEDASVVFIIEPDGTTRKVFHEEIKRGALVSLESLTLRFHTALGEDELSQEQSREQAARADAQKDAESLEGVESPLDKFKNLWRKK
jgi:hypothetical protein